MRRDQRARLFRRAGVAEQPEQRGLAAGRNLDVARHRGAGVAPASTLPESAAPAETGSRQFDRAVVPDEFVAVGRHRLRGAVAGQEGDAVAEIEAVGIARQAARPVSASSRRHDGRRGFARGCCRAPIRHRHRPSACAARGPALRIVSRDSFTGSAGSTSCVSSSVSGPRFAVKVREALPVPRLVAAAKDRARPPRTARTSAAGQIVDVEGLARPVGHRIVRPRRQLEVAAVAAPGEGCAFGRGVEAERALLEMTLIQGCGVAWPGGEPHHIVAAVLGRNRQSRSTISPSPSARRAATGRSGAAGGRWTASRRLVPPRSDAVSRRLQRRGLGALDLIEDAAVARVQHDPRHARAASCRNVSSIRSRRTAKMCWRGPSSLPRRRLFSHSCFDRLLQVLHVGRRLLVDDDEVGDQPARPHDTPDSAARWATMSRSATSPILTAKIGKSPEMLIGHSADCRPSPAAIASAGSRRNGSG